MESMWDQHRFVSGRYGTDIDWYTFNIKSVWYQIRVYVVAVDSIHVDIGLMLNQYGININAYRVSIASM